VLQLWSSKTSVPFLSLRRVNSSSNPTRKVSSRLRASLRKMLVLYMMRSRLDDVLDDVLQNRPWTEGIGELGLRTDMYRFQPSKDHRVTRDIR